VLEGKKEFGPGGMAICLGNGDGTFSSGIFYQSGSDDPDSVVVGDFNGDGIPDVVTAGSQVWLFTGQGGGSFNPGVLAATLQNGAFTLAAGDLNGDKNLGLVVVNLNGPGFIVLFGNGDGTFQSPVAFSEPATALVVAVGSLTKGGPPGIVATASNELYLYFGNGAGKFYGPYVKETPENGGAIAIGDVNGDGIPDLVSAGVYILFGEGGGAFTKPYPYTIAGSVGAVGAYGLALADLRGNGQTDIVTDGDLVSVLLSEGKGLYEDGIWTNVTGGAGCGVKADFNGDGNPDLAVNNANGISVLLGPAKASTPFTAGTNISLAGAPNVWSPATSTATESPTCWSR
jgi:hypothetical protein